jgi:hypothetical protein
MSDITNTSPYAVKAKVELWEGSTLVETCYCEDILQQITLERTCDMSKFFGYGIGQKMNIKLINSIKDVPLTTRNSVKVAFGDGVQFDYPFPTFHITEVHKDEINDTSSVTCYDALNGLKHKTLADLSLSAPYTVRDVARAVANLLGVPLSIINVNDTSFDTYYEQGANYSSDGTELLRDVLDDIAEVTQTIYFINSSDELAFKRLDRDGEVVRTVTKDDYYNLNTKSNRRLAAICKTTELGDNVEAHITQSGTTQYIRDNPFWDNRTDISTLVENALAAMGGLTLNQFDLDWDGDYLLELGDKIDIVAHDDSTVTAYYLDDTITYNGYISAKTEWEYSSTDSETDANPTNLGDRINQTFARVDKIEKNITLYVGEVVEDILPTKIDEAIESALGDDFDTIGEDIANLKATTSTHTENISQLQLTSASINQEVSTLKETTTTITNELDEVVATQETIKSDVGNLQVKSTQISASVTSVETKVTNLEDDIEHVSDQTNGRIDTLSKDVSLKLDKNAVEITVTQKLEEGVDKVVTASKKYTFDDEGLNISAADSSINTTVTEDGMRISKGSQEVLTVNNQGVKAQNLHAYTFLIIGENSRMEDRGNRTACFWIGKAGG